VTDVVARYREPPAPGTDTAAAISILPGGSGANAACWAAHRGHRKVRLLGRTGHTDRDWHAAVLTRSGVSPLLVADDSAPTATVIALVDGSAERTFLTDGGAALRFSAADWSDSLLLGTDHLHLSGYLLFTEGGRALAACARSKAGALGVRVSIDPASAGFIRATGVGIVLAALNGADLLLPNADEALLLTGLGDPRAAAAALSRHARIAAVTLGASGALVAESGAVLAHVRAPEVRAVDSTGAGDAFTGAFLAALAAGADAVSAAEQGCLAGAEAVTSVGGRPVAAGPPDRSAPLAATAPVQPAPPQAG
jgi:sugar/nucleoside kinase (ribokinase family)